MKKVQQILGIRDIKSMRFIGARAIPKVQRSHYLELYMLRNEKDRLEKEIFALDKRMETAKRQIESINKRIKILQKEAHVEQKTGANNDISTKTINTMDINY